MAERRWAPGPWHVFGGDSNRIEDSEDHEVAVATKASPRNRHLTRENAHLIAAAPELYQALDECLKEHGGFTIKGNCERRARAALAKARGEQS